MATSVNLDISQRVDIICRKGDTFDLEFIIEDADGVPVDVTTPTVYTFKMEVRENSTAPDPPIIDTTGDPATGFEITGTVDYLMSNCVINIIEEQPQKITFILRDPGTFTKVLVPQNTITILDKYAMAQYGDKNYVYTQSTPSSSWVVVHNLNKRPSVSVVDSAEDVVYGQVRYISNNEVMLTFAAPFTGKAYFN
jgi:hypothetical protein